jgi:hypothetical protein
MAGGKVLISELLKIPVKIAGGYFLPTDPALTLKKGAEIPEVLLPGLSIGGGQVGVLLQVLEKLLEDGVHVPSIFLISLFHYTLKLT